MTVRGKTSIDDASTGIPGLWRDWFTRAGAAILALIPLGLVIRNELVGMGVMRSFSRPTKIAQLEALEDFSYFFIIYPAAMALFLIVIGAGRTLRRKKFFP